MITISNTDNLIDSRDIIARIEELNAELEEMRAETTDGIDGPTPLYSAEEIADCDAAEELAILEKLIQEMRDETSEWKNGVTLIAYDYFTDYAIEEAKELNGDHAFDNWPFNCINWDDAADALKADYTTVKFGDAEYFIRCS